MLQEDELHSMEMTKTHRDPIKTFSHAIVQPTKEGQASLSPYTRLSSSFPWILKAIFNTIYNMIYDICNIVYHIILVVLVLCLGLSRLFSIDHIFARNKQTCFWKLPTISRKAKMFPKSSCVEWFHNMDKRKHPRRTLRGCLICWLTQNFVITWRKQVLNLNQWRFNWFLYD